MTILAACPLIEPGPLMNVRKTKVRVRCDECGLVSRNGHAEPGTGAFDPCRRCGCPYAVYR